MYTTLLFVGALVLIFVASQKTQVPQLEFSRTISYQFSRDETVAQKALLTFTDSYAELPLFPQGAALRGEDTDRVNVLLLGVAGPHHTAPDLTDTIAVFSFSKNDGKKIVVTIPRDLLVEIPGTKALTKINALYAMYKKNNAGGSSPSFSDETQGIRSSVETITGLPVHYVILVNLSALHNVVEALGGIDVYLEKPLYDPEFPTSSFGTTVFSLSPGWHHLDGAHVEQFARTRHDAEGDFGRVRRQLTLINALQRKAVSLNLIADFPKLFSLYQAISGNIQTDLGIAELRRFWELNKAVNFDDVTYLVLDSHSDHALLTGGLVPLGKNLASSLWPKRGLRDYSEIKQQIADMLSSQGTQ